MGGLGKVEEGGCVPPSFVKSGLPISSSVPIPVNAPGRSAWLRRR